MGLVGGCLFSGVSGVGLAFLFLCGKFKQNTNLNIRIYSHNPTSVINLVHVSSVCLSTPFFYRLFCPMEFSLSPTISFPESVSCIPIVLVSLGLL